MHFSASDEDLPGRTPLRASFFPPRRAFPRAPRGPPGTPTAMPTRIAPLFFPPVPEQSGPTLFFSLLLGSTGPSPLKCPAAWQSRLGGVRGVPVVGPSLPLTDEEPKVPFFFFPPPPLPSRRAVCNGKRKGFFPVFFFPSTSPARAHPPFSSPLRS